MTSDDFSEKCKQFGYYVPARPDMIYNANGTLNMQVLGEDTVPGYCVLGEDAALKCKAMGGTLRGPQGNWCYES